MPTVMSAYLHILRWAFAYGAAVLVAGLTATLTFVIPDFLLSQSSTLGFAQIFFLSIVFLIVSAVFGFPFAFLFSALPEMFGLKPKTWALGLGGVIASYGGLFLFGLSDAWPSEELGTILPFFSRTPRPSDVPIVLTGLCAGLTLGFLRTKYRSEQIDR